MDAFNSREFAAIVWLWLFVIWAATFRSVRESALGVVKAFFSKKIILPVFVMVLYSSLVIYSSSLAGLWENYFLKDTVFWLAGAVVAASWNITSSLHDQRFFQKIVVGLFKLTLILEFLTNLYVFPFWIEFVIFPIILLAVILRAYSESDAGRKAVQSISDWVISIYVLSVLVFSAYNVAINLSAAAMIEYLPGILLSPILTLSILPFLYLFAVWVRYDDLFVRLKVFNSDAELIKYAKRKLLSSFGLNLRALNRWSLGVGPMKCESKLEVDEMIKR